LLSKPLKASHILSDISQKAAKESEKEWHESVPLRQRSSGRSTARLSGAIGSGKSASLLFVISDNVCDRYRETIAHRARRATVQKNAEAGRTTKPWPKARQYWLDLDLVSSDEEDDGEW
jgi:hypothetical protein